MYQDTKNRSDLLYCYSLSIAMVWNQTLNYLRGVPIYQNWEISLNDLENPIPLSNSVIGFFFFFFKLYFPESSRLARWKYSTSVVWRCSTFCNHTAIHEHLFLLSCWSGVWTHWILWGWNNYRRLVLSEEWCLQQRLGYNFWPFWYGLLFANI